MPNRQSRHRKNIKKLKFDLRKMAPASHQRGFNIISGGADTSTAPRNGARPRTGCNPITGLPYDGSPPVPRQRPSTGVKSPPACFHVRCSDYPCRVQLAASLGADLADPTSTLYPAGILCSCLLHYPFCSFLSAVVISLDACHQSTMNQKCLVLRPIGTPQPSPDAPSQKASQLTHYNSVLAVPHHSSYVPSF